MTKSLRLLALSVLALSLLSVSTLAQTGVNISIQNPLQITTLHWYSANRTATFTFAEAPGVFDVAFDGDNIWVTNSSVSSNSVTKLRASDGTVLGTFPVAGPNPAGVAFDGANIWVANSGLIS